MLQKGTCMVPTYKKVLSYLLRGVLLEINTKDFYTDPPEKSRKKYLLLAISQQHWKSSGGR